MAEKVVISFKVAAEIKATLEKLALADERSLSSYIDRVLRNHVAEVGKPVSKRK
jgi:hypothetical protein